MKVQSKDKRYFYDIYHGDDRRWVLGLKNVLFPYRILEKIAYNQVIPLPQALTHTSPLPRGINKKVNDAARNLREDGIVILPAFCPEIAAQIIKDYQVPMDANATASGNYARSGCQFASSALLQFLTNDFMLSLIAQHYQCQPYLRSAPGYNVSYPNLTLEESLREPPADNDAFNVRWHYDTPNLVNAHLLLSDCTTSTTRMLYAKRSHRKHHVNLSSRDYFYSEELVREHYEIVDCVGPAGTIVIFDANGLHRMHPEKGTLRAHLPSMFTPGNAIISNKMTVDPELLRPLTELQRQALKHVIK